MRKIRYKKFDIVRGQQSVGRPGAVESNVTERGDSSIEATIWISESVKPSGVERSCIVGRRQTKVVKSSNIGRVLKKKIDKATFYIGERADASEMKSGVAVK